MQQQLADLVAALDEALVLLGNHDQEAYWARRLARGEDYVPSDIKATAILRAAIARARGES